MSQPRCPWGPNKPARDLISKKIDGAHDTLGCSMVIHAYNPRCSSTILNMNLEIEHPTSTRKKHFLHLYSELKYFTTENTSNLKDLQYWVKRKISDQRSRTRKPQIYLQQYQKPHSRPVPWVFWNEFMFHPAKLLLWFKSEMSPNRTDLEGSRRDHLIRRVLTSSVDQSLCVDSWMDY